jgi:hypothetical protein
MRHLAEFKRGIKGAGTDTGFVVDFSDELILLHNVEWNTFSLNGYTAVRGEDISGYRFFDKADYWQYRAVAKFGLRGVRPVGISAESLEDLLTTASKRFTLVTIHPERRKPDVCYIGAVTAITGKTVTIENLTADAEWSGPRRINLRDITRVDFDSGYERALKATAPKAALSTPRVERSERRMILQSISEPSGNKRGK